MVSASAKAHAALFFSGLIFGANYWIAKGLMPVFMQPMQIVFYRGIITVSLFYIIWRFSGSEKVEKRDLARLIICGMLGVAVNQVFFFTGLNFTSPVDTSLIHAASPLMVLLFSVLINHEKAGMAKITGILLGGAGAVLLILSGKLSTHGSNQFLGNILIFINILAYSLYLVLVKPLMAKYSAITVLKWVFLSGFIFVVPFSLQDAFQVSWGSLSAYAWFALIYIILGATFFTYLLTIFSLRTLSAGTAGYYIYMQPLIASFIGIVFLGEQLSLKKILAAAVIFAGVYLVLRPAPKTNA